MMLKEITPTDVEHAIGLNGWQSPETAPKDGNLFEITTAGPGRDFCWWDDTELFGDFGDDGPCFRVHSTKQPIGPMWPHMVAWRKIAPNAAVGKTEEESRRLNGFSPVSPVQAASEQSSGFDDWTPPKRLYPAERSDEDHSW